MSGGPGGLGDRLIGWCFGILLGAIALHSAVRLIESILPTLLVIIGTVTILGGTFVVISTLRNRW